MIVCVTLYSHGNQNTVEILLATDQPEAATSRTY
jgi:hypothetical protein